MSKTLFQVYKNTVNAQTFVASAQALLDGHFPTYDSGASLTQLGGTFVFGRAHHTTVRASESDEPVVLYEHVDKMTGNHAPVEAIVAALESTHTSVC